jgi:hypothetical protein
MHLIFILLLKEKMQGLISSLPIAVIPVLVFCDPKGATSHKQPNHMLGWNKSFCYNLFMQSKGSIIATAAKKGQFAYGNSDIGGYFTSNFTYCNREISQQISICNTNLATNSR